MSNARKKYEKQSKEKMNKQSTTGCIEEMKKEMKKGMKKGKKE